MEVRLLAARRIGELCPAKPREETGRGKITVRDSDSFPELCPPPDPKEAGAKGGRGRKAPEIREAFPESQRLSEFRKLADIPMPEFKERIEELKAREEKITYNKLLSGGKPHVAHASGENEWYTPPEIIIAARQAMGEIDCDPASSQKANDVVRAKRYFTADDNGLEKRWNGNVWMNPPYAQPLISKFANAIAEKYEAREIKQACILVNNATETEWFQRMLIFASAVCFLRGRVKFLDPEGQPSGAPLQGQAVIYLGENPRGFADAFFEMGIILYGQRNHTE